ncbi:pantetheine-phosphate adenylyltransferase [Planctomycetota bacterium]
MKSTLKGNYAVADVIARPWQKTLPYPRQPCMLNISTKKTGKVMIGLYPGTFDPPTNGHFDIIRRASRLFTKVIVGIAIDVSKDTLFTPQERQKLMQKSIEDLNNVSVATFEGLVANFASDMGANVILRGVRSVADYEYELQMAIANREVSGGSLETMLLLPSLKWSFISSHLVKEIVSLGGDASTFVPPQVYKALQDKYRSLE